MGVFCHFAFCSLGNRLASFFIIPKNCIFEAHLLSSDNFFRQKVTSFSWNPPIPLLHPTKRFVGSFVNVILTRQTFGQRSSRAAASKRWALGNYLFERICYTFQLSKCRGDSSSRPLWIHPFLSVGFCSCTSLLVRIPFLFCVRAVFMIFRVQAVVKNCRICQHCCDFTVVKCVKETCKTAHRIPKETCDKVTRFKQRKKIACV